MFIVPAPFYIRWKIETKYIEGNQTFAYILHKTVHLSTGKWLFEHVPCMNNLSFSVSV